MAGTGHPPYPSGGIADHEGEGSHGVRNDTAGADKGIFTNLIATDNSDIGTDRRTAVHHRRAIFTLAGDERAGIDNVGEDSRWANEDIILEGHAIINRDIVLNLAAIANYGRGHNDDILTERAIGADVATGDEVGEMPNARTGAYRDVVINDSRRVNQLTIDC